MIRLWPFVLTMLALARVAHAEGLDPKRRVIVLEFRAGSSALPRVGEQLVAEIAKRTSLDLLGPAQAKTVFGEGLDQAVVKCAGEADCVARIGQKVGAAEVILVGVSELGDVILTMQRIDVATSAVSARIADALGTAMQPTPEQLRSYLERLLPPSDFKRFGVIAIVANQAGASVTIGGKPRGRTPIDPLKLPAPETYQIKVEKRGFVPFTTKVQLPPDSELKVEAQLTPRGASHWYQKWYVLAGVGVLGAGLVGGTIYFATREPSDTVGVTGTIN